METPNEAGSLPVLGWVFAALLLMIALICWVAGSGKIAPNGAVGLRIPPLTRSTSAWKAGHAAGVAPASIAFVVALVCSVVGLFAPPAYWGAVAALVGGLIWVIAAAVRAANAATG